MRVNLKMKKIYINNTDHSCCKFIGNFKLIKKNLECSKWIFYEIYKKVLNTSKVVSNNETRYLYFLF